VFSVAGLLAVWEEGLGQHAASRPVTLLAAASPGASWEDVAALPIGERDDRLMAVREALFGSTFEGVASCASCGEALDVSFRADQIRPSPATAAAGAVRLPDSYDLLAVAHLPDVPSARQALVARCVPGGRDDAAVISEMAEADPSADIRLGLECPACGAPVEVLFDVTAFLWAEIEAEVEALLLDVRDLAAAYGWSEADIMAMPDARRRRYLDLIGQ
jgi:hypothetical protein